MSQQSGVRFHFVSRLDEIPLDLHPKPHDGCRAENSFEFNRELGTDPSLPFDDFVDPVRVAANLASQLGLRKPHLRHVVVL